MNDSYDTLTELRASLHGALRILDRAIDQATDVAVDPNPTPSGYSTAIQESGQRIDGPFTEAYVTSHPSFPHIVVQAVKGYGGKSTYIRAMQKRIAEDNALSTAQVRACANIIYRETQTHE